MRVEVDGVITFVWFGEVVLEASREFVAQDANGTLVAALLREQVAIAAVGGCETTTPLLLHPVSVRLEVS